MVKYILLFLVWGGFIFLNQKEVYSADRDFANSLDQMVRIYHDPLLEASVREALKNNNDVHKAMVRLTKSQGLVAKAKAGLKPLLNLRAGAVHLAGIEGDSLERLSNSISVDLSWDIDIWREARLEWDSQKARLSASEADLSFIKHYIAAQTVKSWFLAIETKLQLDLAAKSLEYYRNILRIIQLKYAQGFAQKQELSAAKAKLAKAQEVYFQLRGAHTEVLRSIELLLGRYPEGKIVISKNLPSLPKWPRNLAVSSILKNRDDILAAKYRFDAAALNLERTKKRGYPELKLTSSLIKSSPELNTQAKDRKAFSASGIGVDVPLIDGGKGQADISILSAEKDEAALEYQQKNKAALGEIETVFMNEEILKKREEYLEVVFKENIEALELAKRQYESGTIDLLIVIYHRLQADETEASLLHLKAAQLIQRADLYLIVSADKNRL